MQFTFLEVDCFNLSNTVLQTRIAQQTLFLKEAIGGKRKEILDPDRRPKRTNNSSSEMLITILWIAVSVKSSLFD